MNFSALGFFYESRRHSTRLIRRLGYIWLQHGLHMCSACGLLGSGPVLTTYTNNFTCVLQYLWYSLDSVAATAFMEILDKNILFGGEPQEREGMGIPNSWWSSEHVSLVAEFHLLWRTVQIPPAPSPSSRAHCLHKCDCTLSCCLYSLIYTIRPSDKTACRYSFGIIRSICNQPGMHFACTIQRSTYVQSLILVRTLNTVHESVSNSSSFW